MARMTALRPGQSPPPVSTPMRIWSPSLRALLCRCGGAARAHTTLTALMAVIAIDAGTTGVRALAVDDEGRPVASAYRELAQHYPRPGWVEHDAIDIWQLAITVLDEVARTIDRPIAGIGITNQRETVV